MANINGFSLDRLIDTFPLPYKKEQTPYTLTDFNETTAAYVVNVSHIIPDIKTSKVIILGDVSVGKTCLVNRFCHQLFNSNYKATIGVDFEVEQFCILGVPFHLQIWDTAGQERFKCIAQSYYRFAHVIVITFDLSNIRTLYNCKTWLEEALNASDDNPHIFLVGTKKDLLSSAAYSQIEEISIKYANTLKAEYWAVSSQTGEGVRDLFFRIAVLTFDAVIGREESKREIPLVENEIISLKKNKVTEKQRFQCCNL